MRGLLAGVGFGLIFVSLGLAQAPPAAPPPPPGAVMRNGTPPTFADKADPSIKVPSFDVISVKPARAGSGPGMGMAMGVRIMPDGFTASNLPAHFLLMQGFKVNDNQITGEPGWLKTDRWDIEAKVAGEDVATLSKLTFDQRQSMFQQVLADRFALKLHHETREMPVYALVVAKGGSKLTESKPDPNAPGGATTGPGRRMMMGRGRLEGQGTTIDFLISALSGQAGRNIIDKTGLTGRYDFSLNWSPDEGGGGGGGMGRPGDDPPHAGPPGAGPAPAGGDMASGPSLFTALEEQLGLKLVPEKGPVDVIVIDSVGRPAEN